jgi:hypothetical protein
MFSSIWWRRTKGSRTRDNFLETGAVGLVVETQALGGDHLDIEIGEIAAGGGADTVEPASHDMQGILGGVEQDAPGPLHGEAAQAGRAGGDSDGKVEGEDWARSRSMPARACRW